MISFTESDLNSQATWAGAENRMAASKIVNEKRNNLQDISTLALNLNQNFEITVKVYLIQLYIDPDQIQQQ